MGEVVKEIRMTSSAGERRSLSWKDIALWLVAILISLSGFLLRDLYSQVQDVKVNKLDKTEFYQIVDRSDKKTDLIIQLLRDHERVSRER